MSNLKDTMPNMQQRVVTRFTAAAKSKFEKGDKVTYKNKDCKVVEVASNGKVTIRSGGGATKTFKPEDAEKALTKTASGKKLNEKDIANLKSLTSRNNHTEAYIKGSGLVGATHTAKKLELVGKLVKLEGHLQGDLSKYQYQLYQEMLTQAKRTLSPEGYEEFYGCF